MKIRKADGLGPQLVQIWRQKGRIPVHRQITIALIICHDHNDVRTLV